METLNIVVMEILLCLALAWLLGFLVAWILFRRVQKEYENELEELEENLLHLNSANSNKEREITMQNLKIQELESSLNSEKKVEKKEDALEKTEEESQRLEKIKKKSQDEEILRLIESNLYSPKKK